MKFLKIYRFLLAVVAATGCNDRRPPAEATALDWEKADPVSGAPLTPGGAIYGEVVAATDEIIEILAGVPDADSAAAATPNLHRAVERYEAAARNWKFYLMNTDDLEVKVIERSRLVEHADQSDERLRENLLRLTRDPTTEALKPEIQNLLRALREGMTADEWARFELWLAEGETEERREGVTEGRREGVTE